MYKSKVLEDNYFKAKEINYFLKAFGLTNTEADEDLDINEECIYTKELKMILSDMRRR